MSKPIVVYAVEVDNGYLTRKWGPVSRCPRLWLKPSFPRAVAEQYNSTHSSPKVDPPLEPEARVVAFRLMQVPCSLLPKDEALRKAAIDDMEAQKLITKKEAEQLRGT